MMNILVDSGTDLPDSIIKEYNISVIKNGIAENTKGTWKEFPNDKNMLEEIVEKSKKGVEFKTSATSLGRLKQIFDELTIDGESVVYISITSRGSKVHDIAVSAKNELQGRDITIIDSGGAFSLHSIITLSLARAIRSGKSKKEAIDSALKTKENSKCIIGIPDISYLYKTGRLPQGKDMSKSVLKLIVIVGFLHEEDKVFSLIGRERNIKTANRMIVSFIEKDLKTNKKGKVRCIVGSNLNKDAVIDLENKIKKGGWCEELILAEEHPEASVIVGPNSWMIGYELL